MLVKPFTIIRAELKDAPRPNVGDIDVVISEGANRRGDKFYFLQRFGSELSYVARNFATLPDASADEMQEEEQFIYEPLSC